MKRDGFIQKFVWSKKPGDEVVVKQGESSAGSKRLGGLVKVQYIREHGKNEGALIQSPKKYLINCYLKLVRTQPGALWEEEEPSGRWLFFHRADLEKT